MQGVRDVQDTTEVAMDLEPGKLKNLQEKLLHKGFLKESRSVMSIRTKDAVFMNRMVVF